MEQGISIIERKAEMYEMIIALETDFIANFKQYLSIDDIPDIVIQHSNKSNDIDKLTSILQGIDFQAYIEICNSNINKLHLTMEHRNFLNKEFLKIIPIRNNVMHPRPLGVFDYPILKEVFNIIDKYVDVFNWCNVKQTRVKILKHPDELRLPPSTLKKSENIIENLPTTIDYEETSFIGRSREIGELKAKLHKKNVNILSIIGDGGIGKTALTLKLLYDILDDPSFDFELILWVSLKTNSLNEYEFSEIKDSINSVTEMYEKLGSFVSGKDIVDMPNYMIELAQTFKTLLVLDNLETINTSEIKEFLDDFTEYGKVLITSRIGLGEMEHRYKLDGLEKQDLMTYMDILLSLYGLEGILSNDDKIDIAVNKLYSNPLAIKWFVRCLYNKQSVSEILDNRNKLTDFCMSNVYDKLSDLAHKILNLLMVAGGQITFAELMYYMECNISDYTDMSYAINELIKCNFLDDLLFKSLKKLAITSFANDFLRTINIDNHLLVVKFKQMESKIQAFSQQLLQSMYKSPYMLKSFEVQNNDRSQIIAAYYLMEAITYLNNKEVEKAHLLVEYAKKLAPNYYECNKVNAFIYGTTSQLKAKQEYEIALANCHLDNELARMYIIYAGFLLRCNDYLGAIEKLEQANKIEPHNQYLKFERCKVLACVNRFDKAEDILNKMDFKLLSERNQNIFLTRKADLLRRKSEIFDQRNIKDKFQMIQEAFSILEMSCSPDDGIYSYMGVLLKSLVYMYFDTEVMQYMISKLETYYTKLRRTLNYKDFQLKMQEKVNMIDDEILKNKILKYIKNFNEIMETLPQNQGIVYSLNKEKKFGFFKNIKFPKGVYFKVTERINIIEIGDTVEFDEILETEKGAMVRHMRIIN